MKSFGQVWFIYPTAQKNTKNKHVLTQASTCALRTYFFLPKSSRGPQGVHQHARRRPWGRRRSANKPPQGRPWEGDAPSAIPRDSTADADARAAGCPRLSPEGVEEDVVGAGGRTRSCGVSM